MEIHTPDVYGDIKLAGSPGTAGQVLTSSGVGVQAGWSTPTPVGIHKFTSAASVSHTITHNLNNAYPAITVWSTAATEVIIPANIESNSANQLTITFALPTAIAGTVVG